MILLRGICGEQYARKIERGSIGFRDLLSTLTNPTTTGYTLSGFNEKTMRGIVCNSLKRLEYEKHIHKKYIEKLRLIFHPVIPFCYVSYFHVVNSTTRQWIDSFSDDVRFIFVRPLLDERSQNMIGRHILGRQMEYVKNLYSYDKEGFLFDTLGMLCLLEEDFVANPGIDDLMRHTGGMHRILRPFFTREVDNQYSSFESEFRMLYKIPTIVEHGLYRSPTPKIIRLFINGIEYYGRTGYFKYPNGKESIDTYLKTDSPMIAENETTLLKELRKGCDFSIIPEFKEVNIKKCAIDYGYIGNKDDCLRFLVTEK